MPEGVDVARLGEHLPKLLTERGIDVAFGVPSAHTMELYRAPAGLRLVSARHPTHAGFMADGYARMGGTPAACILPHGPGLAAVAPAAAQALADTVPMLLLTTSQPTTPDGRRGGHRHTLRDPAGLLRSLCLWSRRADTIEAVAEALDDAAAQFHVGRRGPLHIEVPVDALAADAGALTPGPRPLPEPRIPSAAMVAEIIMRAGTAAQPVLILGGGALGMGAAVARQLAERLAATVLLTNAGRGLLPSGHPLLVGGHLASAPVKALLAEADCVLAIGTELSPEEWGLAGDERLALQPDALIRVDIDPDRLYQSATPAVAVAADAALLVEAVLANTPVRSLTLPDLAPLRRGAVGTMPYRLQRHRTLIESLWEHLPEAVVFGDPCEPTTAALDCAAPPAPRRWMTAAAGLGVPGWALPAAIGAKLADPRRPVVAMMGDVAVLSALGELATAVEVNAHIVLLVWNNTGLGEVREQMKADHIKPHGVDMSGVDLQPIARGLGAAYARVHGPDYFREAIRTAIMRPGPTILELREDYWFG